MLRRLVGCGYITTGTDVSKGMIVLWYRQLKFPLMVSKIVISLAFEAMYSLGQNTIQWKIVTMI